MAIFFISYSLCAHFRQMQQYQNKLFWKPLSHSLVFTKKKKLHKHSIVVAARAVELSEWGWEWVWDEEEVGIYIEHRDKWEREYK